MYDKEGWNSLVGRLRWDSFGFLFFGAEAADGALLQQDRDKSSLSVFTVAVRGFSEVVIEFWPP